MEENRLITKAQNGNHDAFKDLMENHQAKVYRLLLGFLRDEHAAEEATVETFTKAWKNLPGFRQESTFWTWLYRIAYRVAIDYQRRWAGKLYFVRGEYRFEGGGAFRGSNRQGPQSSTAPSFTENLLSPARRDHSILFPGSVLPGNRSDHATSVGHDPG